MFNDKPDGKAPTETEYVIVSLSASVAAKVVPLSTLLLPESNIEKVVLTAFVNTGALSDVKQSSSEAFNPDGFVISKSHGSYVALKL